MGRPSGEAEAISKPIHRIYRVNQHANRFAIEETGIISRGNQQEGEGARSNDRRESALALIRGCFPGPSLLALGFLSVLEIPRHSSNSGMATTLPKESREAR